LAVQVDTPAHVDLDSVRATDPATLQEQYLPEEGSAAAATKPAVNETLVQQLMTMGFPRNRCERAVHSTGNQNADVAMEWLLSHMDDPDIDQPLVAASSASKPSVSIDPEKLSNLESMGFTAAQAKVALKETV
jgi:ubiquitin carboxyl-terminal hydrolase 5/13